MTTLSGAAVGVLITDDPAEKCALTHDIATAWKRGQIEGIGEAVPPTRPARPEHPPLLAPREMPKRRMGSEAGRIAFIHSIAHIELNAIDLAWDIIARFHDQGLPAPFYDDWIKVAEDEALHFEMLNRRLHEFGAQYGDLPAHDGLWEAAEETADDLKARLALVPMLLEARGLDTSPMALEKLELARDLDTAAILQKIAEDEIGHVAVGVRWFNHLCEAEGGSPVETFHALVSARFKGSLKPPFNAHARLRAGMTADYYEPLAK